METISTLAHLSKFVIADLTEARSVLQELQHIVPNLPSVPVQPILLFSETEPGMLDHFRKFSWFLDIYKYNSVDELINSIDQKIILPALNACNE